MNRIARAEGSPAIAEMLFAVETARAIYIPGHLSSTLAIFDPLIGWVRAIIR